MRLTRNPAKPLLISLCAAAISVAFAIRIANAVQAVPTPQSAASAQSATPPSFDAASIKERDGGVPLGVVGLQFLPGRIVAHCATLKGLLFYAYNLTLSSPIEGLPNWASTPCSDSGTKDTYDFQATMPPDAPPGQARQMMETLLVDRFKLAVHWEKKIMPVYALVVAPGGFKLKPADPDDANKPLSAEAFRCPADDPDCRRAVIGGTMVGFASLLSVSAGRPVIDKTGITGKYDAILKWASDTAPNSSLPSFPTAVRETLGLELKSETDSVDVLVVDHAERPTPN